MVGFGQRSTSPGDRGLPAPRRPLLASGCAGAARRAAGRRAGYRHNAAGPGCRRPGNHLHRRPRRDWPGARRRSVDQRFLRVNERHRGDRQYGRPAPRPDPYPRPAPQRPGCPARRPRAELRAGPRPRLRHGAVARPAHQRQGAVLLLRDTVRIRVEVPDRRQRGHLGSPPHIRASASGATSRSARPSSTSWRCSAAAPSLHSAASQAFPRSAVAVSPTTDTPSQRPSHLASRAIPRQPRLCRIRCGTSRVARRQGRARARRDSGRRTRRTVARHDRRRRHGRHRPGRRELRHSGYESRLVTAIGWMEDVGKSSGFSTARSNSASSWARRHPVEGAARAACVADPFGHLAQIVLSSHSIRDVASASLGNTRADPDKPVWSQRNVVRRPRLPSSNGDRNDLMATLAEHVNHAAVRARPAAQCSGPLPRCGPGYPSDIPSSIWPMLRSGGASPSPDTGPRGSMSGTIKTGHDAASTTDCAVLPRSSRAIHRR